MKKTVIELLALVDDICPDIKASERLFVVSLIMDEYEQGYIDGSERALEIIKGEEK